MKTLKNNIQLIIHRIDYLGKLDPLTNNSYHRLVSRVEKVEETFEKLCHNRIKRGLLNGLGSVIKFITGNLDDNDFQTLTDNMDKLYNTQNSNIEKINDVISLANHITDRLNDQTKILNQNLNVTKNLIKNLKYTEDIRLLIQNEMYQAEYLLNYLQMLERTLSLSMHEIPNLEILTKNEIIRMHNYLENIYGSNQLLPFDSTHLFKLLKLTKMSIVGINQNIVFLLKIPILKPFLAKYSSIYPLPNKNDLFILPPKKFLIRFNKAELWTDEECERLDVMNFCTKPPIEEHCSTQNTEECMTAKATNEYQITHILNNNQLLFISKKPQKVIENCQGLITSHQVQGSNLLSSQCNLIIGSYTYSNTFPVYNISTPNISILTKDYSKFEMGLELRNFNNPDQLKIELQDMKPTITKAVTRNFHYSLTGIIAIILLSIFCIMFMYRTRIAELFCKPRAIIHLTSSTIDLHQLNEAVQPRLTGEELCDQTCQPSS